MFTKLSKIASLILPKVLYETLRRRLLAVTQRAEQPLDIRSDALRDTLRLARERSKASNASRRHSSWSYDDGIKWLQEFGLDGEQCRGGSIPEDVIAFAWETIATDRRDRGPIKLLHIGNFVGVSLCALASRLDHNQGDLIVGLDPDIKIRGISNCAHAAMMMANHFGLQNAIVSIQAYSRHRSSIIDGASLYVNDVENSYEMSLDNLQRIASGSFSAAIIDGNHDHEYMIGEIEICLELLDQNGLLLLDDVDEYWPDVRNVYQGLCQREDLEPIAHYKRMAVLRKRSPGQGRSATISDGPLPAVTFETTT